MDRTINSDSLNSSLEHFRKEEILPTKEITDIWIKTLKKSKIFLNFSKEVTFLENIISSEPNEPLEAEKYRIHFEKIIEFCEFFCMEILNFSGLEPLCSEYVRFLEIPKFITFYTLISISTNNANGLYSYDEFIYSILKDVFPKKYSSFEHLKSEVKLNHNFEDEEILESIRRESARFRKYRDHILENNEFYLENQKRNEFNPSVSRKTSNTRKNGDFKIISPYNNFGYTIDYLLSIPSPANRKTSISKEKREQKENLENYRQQAFENYWEPIWKTYFSSLASRDTGHPLSKEIYYELLKEVYTFPRKGLKSNKNLLVQSDFDFDIKNQIFLYSFSFAIEKYGYKYKSFEEYLFQRFFVPIDIPKASKHYDQLFSEVLEIIPFNFLKKGLNDLHEGNSFEKAQYVTYCWEPAIIITLNIFSELLDSLKIDNYEIFVIATNYINLPEYKSVTDDTTK